MICVILCLQNEKCGISLFCKNREKAPRFSSKTARFCVRRGIKYDVSHGIPGTELPVHTICFYPSHWRTEGEITLKDNKKKKRKKWRHPRHVVVRNLLSVTLGVYTRVKYNVKVDKFKEQGNRPYLILFNHQTAFDQFFVGMAFRGPIYYVASEDIFTKGWVSMLIKYLVAPIPIKKQSADITAVMNCIRVAKEGGTIAMAPEGNRTFGGSTGYMNDAIVPLARKLGLPIALYRIEGGYGVHPRWSDKVRGGGMRGYVSEVIEPECYAEMTNEELYTAIKDGLSVVEGRGGKSYPTKTPAEYIERAFYVCPDCGMTELYSEGDTVTCQKCGRRITVGTDMTVMGEGLPFTNVGEWYDWQEDYINSIDPRDMGDTPLHTAKCRLYEVIPYKKKELIGEDVDLALYSDRIVAGDVTLSFDGTSVVTVLGRNKLNIYHGGNVYQIKSEKRFCALRYMNIFYRVKNLAKENENDRFLGL